MQHPERATLTAKDESTKDQPDGQRARHPDDPKLRVELAPGFRRELTGEKRVSVAAAVDSPRTAAPQQHLDPSSVSRYAHGRTDPTLLTARRLADALRKPVDEVVVGFSEHYGRPTVRWARQLLFTRAYRAQVLQLIDGFHIVLRHVHFGVVSDAQRPERHLTRPEEDCSAYRVMDVVFDRPLTELVGTDIVLAYRLLDRPPIFVDYGDVRIEADRVVTHEFWTHRSDIAPVVGDVCCMRIKTWIDGHATDFLLRSGRPFTMSSMREANASSKSGGPLVTFLPGGIHRYAPPEA